MLEVGLTGSIATGKTFVAGCLSELGCQVSDADQVARDVVKKGTEGLDLIVKTFGDDVLLQNGELDRSKLGKIVFNDQAKREQLNSIVHPRVIASQNIWLSQLREAGTVEIAVIEAALMIESEGYKRFDMLIVTWCEPAIQLKRLMLRDGLSESEARARIAAQMLQEEKKAYANHLIDTSHGFEDTRRQTKEVYLDLRKHLEPDNEPKS